ncbi:MAG: hypothetical protein IKH61_03920 [Bacteroidales bacterium]|nr:hypothetical protein [Bacteroidales bacterium]
MELLVLLRSMSDFFEFLLWLLISAPLALLIAGVWYLVKYAGKKHQMSDDEIKNLLVYSFFIAFIITFVLSIVIVVAIE